MPDPVEERAALEGVVQLARAVRGEDDRRRATRAYRPELRNRDLEVGEHLEQERLELLVRAVDLVDQQHDLLVGVDRLEQRPADEELRPEELRLGYGAFLRRANVQQLARVVPLVHRVRDVESLVALEPDQVRAEGGREEERRREAAIGQVVDAAERALQLIDRAEAHRAPSVHRSTRRPENAT